ncbi:hypothetical protein [Flagellimonas sp.]|uniref:hypothetical protein n=1 Tax=Flagellimonas sp. TaxID=2058762 RepID=UPI003B59682D
MKNSSTTSEREKLHWETLKWKSHLLLMDSELYFITQLLNSYAFEQHTPNLFERLTDYKSQIKKIEERKDKLKTRLVLHESTHGDLDKPLEITYKNEHVAIETEVMSCIEGFQNLKLEIFNYTGGILRKV